MTKTITNKTQRAQVAWSNALSIGSGASEYEMNLQHVWAELGEKPSSIRHGFGVNAPEFWAYLNARFAPVDADIRVSTDFMLSKTDELLESNFYFIRLTPEVYVSFTDYTPEYEADEVEHADIVPRRVGDLNFYYKNSADTARRLSAALKDIHSMRIPDMTKQQYFVIQSTLGGHKLRRSVPTKVDTDIEMTFGQDFVSLHDSVLAGATNGTSSTILVTGESGSGKSVYLRYLQEAVSKVQKVVYVPGDMHKSVGSVRFIDFIISHGQCLVVLEDIDEQHDNPEFLAAVMAIKKLDKHVSVAMVIEDDSTLNDNFLAAVTHRVEMPKLTAKAATELSAKLKIGHTYIKDVLLEEVYNDGEPDESKPSFGYTTRRD